MTKKTLEADINKEVKPIRMVIRETGKPADDNNWDNYKREVVEIKPTLNTREAILKAEQVLKQKEIKIRHGK